MGYSEKGEGSPKYVKVPTLLYTDLNPGTNIDLFHSSSLHRGFR